MIVGIDGNEANVEHRVGVSWCAFYLLKEFQKKANNELQIRVFLRTVPRSDMPQPTKNFSYVVVKGSFLWSQIFLPLALYTAHRDLSVFLSLAHYAPRFCPVPSVVVLHDLSYFYYPEDFLKKDLYQLLEWTKYSVKNATKVIAVSENTRNDAILLYRLPEDKVVTIHNGVTLPTKDIAEGERTISPQKPYFLYVGTLQPRKNIINLIYAFDRFQINHPDFHLYIAGKKGWLYDEFYKLASSRKLENKVHFTGYVSDSDQWNLYKNAEVFIAPEFYGGFGLTIPEAQSVGVPVIASSTGAFPEVGGDACLYINPFNIDSIVEGMEKITSDQSVRQQLIAKGYQQCKNFTWSKSVNQYISVLDTVCHPRARLHCLAKHGWQESGDLVL